MEQPKNLYTEPMGMNNGVGLPEGVRDAGGKGAKEGKLGQL